MKNNLKCKPSPLAYRGPSIVYQSTGGAVVAGVSSITECKGSKKINIGVMINKV